MRWPNSDKYFDYCCGFFTFYVLGTIVLSALQSFVGLASLFLVGLILTHGTTKS